MNVHMVRTQIACENSCFFFTPCHLGRFVKRDVCVSATEILVRSPDLFLF